MLFSEQRILIQSLAKKLQIWNKIATHYLTGFFVIDMIAIIPFDEIFIAMFPDHDELILLKLHSLLKLSQIKRFKSLISHLHLSNSIKILLRLVMIFSFIIIYLHVLAWVWYRIVISNKIWLPPLDYVYVVTHFYEENNWYQYSNMLYHAVLMLIGSDLGPRNELQFWFVTIILLIGAIINAIIFGNIASMVHSLNRQSDMFQEKIDMANEAMKNLNIPYELSYTVQNYLSHTYSASNHQKELDSFLSMLSPSLRQKVTNSIFKSYVFQGQMEVQTDFLNHLQIRLFLPEDIIIKQDDVADWMYFLARGDCDIFVTDWNKKEELANTIKEGEYFGEIGIIKKCKRTASVHSKNHTTIAELSKVSFNSLWIKFPFVKTSMEKSITKQYNDKWRKFVKRSIKNIDFLSYHLSDHIIDDISYLFEITSLSQGEYLYKKGTTWRDIHIISNGEVNIYLEDTKEELYLDTLYAGCTTGSYASLNADDYTVSAKAKTDCIILRLPYIKLHTLRNKYKKLDEAISRYERYCDENGIPYCDYKLHRNSNLQWSPIQKFKHGIIRIVRIIKSFKSSALTDLLEKVREEVKIKKNKREKKRKEILLKSTPLTTEQRNEQSLIILTQKIEDMKEIINNQNNEIKMLRSEILSKLDSLQTTKQKDDDNHSQKPEKHVPRFSNVSPIPKKVTNSNKKK